MHEAEKLREADYFYSQLIDPDESRGFIYNLRALLGSARSVLVYAYEETKGNPKGKHWYEHAVQDPVIAFLRRIRNVDTHERPIGTSQTIHLPAGAVMIGRRGQTEHFRPASTSTHHFAGWTRFGGRANAVPTLSRSPCDVY